MAAEKLRPLTWDQVAILKKTFRSLNTDRVASRFYSSLFEQHPEVQSLFPKDTSDLATKLISVFELIVFSFEERKPNQFYLQASIMVPLRSLGKKHEEKGVQNHHYPIANQLLLEAIRKEAGYVLPKEVEDAWKLALAHLTSAMLNEEVEDEIPRNTMRDTFNYIKALFK
jgi:hemoglobin-like flavoprotein